MRGLSPRILLVERTPDPALRATFSHRGRRKEEEKRPRSKPGPGVADK
jgi:hypothetical protein